MYDEYNKMKESLDKIKVNSEGDIREGDVDSVLIGYIGGEDIHNICNGIADINPVQGKEAFYTFFDKLTIEDLWKIFILLDRLKDSEKVDLMQRVACELSLKVFVETLSIPCKVASMIEEKGHIEGCEKVLGYYIPQDDFEKFHEKAHEVMIMIGSTEHMGGDIHQIHQN